MTRDEIEAELGRIADELDAVHTRETALFDNRRELWKVGRDVHGMNSKELARPSRVESATVRTLLPPREE